MQDAAKLNNELDTTIAAFEEVGSSLHAWTYRQCEEPKKGVFTSNNTGTAVLQ